MNGQQSELLDKIRSMQEALTQEQVAYWMKFSDISTWQFWVDILTVFVPLIVLFILIDRSKALLLGFFGLNYHLWFHYVNSFGISYALWHYPYQILPFIPSFAIDAALIPICFMLLYQWTLKRDKNIYLYAILLSAFFAFVMKPIMVYFDFFQMFKGVNYFHLFLFYFGLFIVSKLITNVFIWLQNKGGYKTN